ncbi:MAG: pantoate--beta-alanine ligase [Acidobacteria bacterium]|nr:pantoate--beta-alanine ligase [Acidobacteriota bacterium]
MSILRTIPEARAWVSEQRRQGLRSGWAPLRIGLVPTMGALHAGHVSLVERSVADCDRTVLSIFVNPTQFGPGEDYERYPRTWERDLELATAAGAHAVFTPATTEMYGAPQQMAQIAIDPGRLAEPLCGAFRPGHFRGVATVVAKLFNIVQADAAFFGQKDAQQVIIIQNMVRELNFSMEIVVCPIIREQDGLALSSRNAYLSAEDRATATVLSRALRQAEASVKSGIREVAQLERQLLDTIGAVPGARIDYARIVDRETLGDIATITKPALAAVAVRFGATRLIDNIILDPEQ